MLQTHSLFKEEASAVSVMQYRGKTQGKDHRQCRDMQA